MERIVILGNKTEWCDLALSDRKKYSNITFYNFNYPCRANSLQYKIARVLLSPALNKKVKLPFHGLCYSGFCKNMFQKDETGILLIYDRNILANNREFLQYMRKHRKNVKLVYMFTNIIRLSGAGDNGFIDELKHYYDIVYAFDPMDAQEKGFHYSPLIYSSNSMDVQPENNVFYVGKAKDRYPMLVSVFQKLEALGIPKKFFVFGVDESEQIEAQDIVFNQLLPYETCIRNIQAASCILDIIQGNSSGFTIKVCEAIFYNKLLITTNQNIKQMPFYDERFILVIRDADDIQPSFFKNWDQVQYNESGQAFFSLDGFIQRMRNDLNLS